MAKIRKGRGSSLFRKYFFITMGILLASFGIFGMDERDAEAYVRDYFARHAENGVLHDESRMRYALLTWNVN